jgi:SAM-dependent methyltransferase
MKKETIQQLNRINQDFYQIDSNEFNQTRSFFWAGWDNLLKFIKKNEKINIFDVGCGNARFALFLKKHNFKFNYFGCDLSTNLLDFAKKNLLENKISFNLKNIDLVNQTNNLNKYENKFDLITLFGVWHHLPSEKKREEIIKSLLNLLENNDYLIVTFWQFAIDKKLTTRNSPKFKNFKIDEKDLEKNDYLLTWEKGIKKHRYCHFSNLEEVENFAKKLNLKIIDHYYDDGKNKKMNLYVIFQKS